jgi:hypothetical protein
MDNENAERIYIDRDAASALSDTLVKHALDSKHNVLTAFAAMQLAILSLAQVVLSAASEPEDVEANKATLATISATVSDTLENLHSRDVGQLQSQFEFAAQAITDKHSLH